jgi:hypothetical protein
MKNHVGWVLNFLEDGILKQLLALLDMADYMPQLREDKDLTCKFARFKTSGHAK